MDAHGLRGLLRKEIAKARDTQENYARKLEISPAYLSDVLAGRCDAGPKVLNALGLKRVVRYRWKDK